MDILIKNMELPKQCIGCAFSYWNMENDNLWCPLIDKKVQRTEKEKECPLVELPPHGELVRYLDVKNAIIKAVGKDNNLWCDIMDVVDEDAPTILEASK